MPNGGNLMGCSRGVVAEWINALRNAPFVAQTIQLHCDSAKKISTRLAAVLTAQGTGCANLYFLLQCTLAGGWRVLRHQDNYEASSS